MKWLTLDIQLLGKSLLKSVKSRAGAKSVCKQKKLSVSFWDCGESPIVLSPIFLQKDFYLFYFFSGKYFIGLFNYQNCWNDAPYSLMWKHHFLSNFMDLVWQTHSSGENVHSFLWRVTQRLYWRANNCLWRKRNKCELAGRNPKPCKTESINVTLKPSG